MILILLMLFLVVNSFLCFPQSGVVIADSTFKPQGPEVVLPEITVKAIYNRGLERVSALPVEEINRNYLMQRNSINFAQTLATVAGVNSMDIGSGFSKPMIRGMGFNRVAIVDRGIVQQNQQWGADHGLEIDQYDVDNVRVFKGPMSLFYGSDAIGGVIEIRDLHVPELDVVWGDITLIGKSGNDLLGTSIAAGMKSGDFYLRARTTVQSYADYRIPAKHIDYLTWRLPVYDGRMKNTAGREYSVSIFANYDNDILNSRLNFSNVYAKNGFFPGAHGVPSLDRLEPDESYRNIDSPFSTSNHLKLIWNGERKFDNNSWLKVNLGYQFNNRKELAEFHTHYSNQKAPELNADVELLFALDTYTAGIRFEGNESEKWSRIIGTSVEFQYNRVGGYSFLLPDFNRQTAGFFWINKLNVNKNLIFIGGVRYDLGRINVVGFYDPVLEKYLRMQGYSDGDVNFYAQRAIDVNRDLSDFTGSVGLEYIFKKYHSLKINVGNSFRYPGANEMGANGVHHGAFRHEMGNVTLDSEKGYQIDADYQYNNSKLRVRINPFATWFSNYIYLEPTGQWSILPHAGQVYKFEQSEAFMVGGELMAEYLIDEYWRVSSDLEYVYNVNLDDNYPLPFSPPTVVSTDMTYSGLGGGVLSQYMFGVNNRMVMKQNRVAKNEEFTPGACIWSLRASAHLNVRGNRYVVQLQANNIFNTPYLNHLSFYRKLNAPEAGRSIDVILKYSF